MKTIRKRNYLIKKQNVTVCIRIPDTLKKELNYLASILGLGFSHFVQNGLDQWAYLYRNKLKKINKR